MGGDTDERRASSLMADSGGRFRHPRVVNRSGRERTFSNGRFTAAPALCVRPVSQLSALKQRNERSAPGQPSTRVPASALSRVRQELTFRFAPRRGAIRRLAFKLAGSESCALLRPNQPDRGMLLERAHRSGGTGSRRPTRMGARHRATALRSGSSGGRRRRDREVWLDPGRPPTAGYLECNVPRQRRGTQRRGRQRRGATRSHPRAD